MTEPMPSRMPTGAELPQKKKRGCFFYGCLTTIILLILGVGAAYFGIKYVYHQAIEKFTTTTALSIPSVSATQSDYESTNKRLVEFKAAMDSGNGPESLTLTANDLNSLISFHPKSILKDHAAIEIKGNQTYAKFSMPLDKFGIPGRFLNGEGAINISLQDGKLHVEPGSIVVNGTPVPAEILKSFAEKDAALDMIKDPEARSFFEKLKSIKIENGAVTVMRR